MLIYKTFLFTQAITALNIINFLDSGAQPSDGNKKAYTHNTNLLNQILQDLQPNQTLLFPEGYQFYLNGGIFGNNLYNNTFIFNSDLIFQNNRRNWPKKVDKPEKYEDAIIFTNLTQVLFTSNKKDGTLGKIDGQGQAWWGYLDYVINTNNRPKLFNIYESENIVYENIFLKDSPRFHFDAQDVLNLTVRNSKIDARYDHNQTTHTLHEISAFNTDGFDVAGKNIHIYNVEVFNEDDSIAVKQSKGNYKKATCSENILIENSTLSGVGLTIGSITAHKYHTCVKNVLFRNIYMPKTLKGIYFKVRPDKDEGDESGEISNILYENVTIVDPDQYPIWIGPQQAYRFMESFRDPCPLVWGLFGNNKTENCYVDPTINVSNITLKDIQVHNGKYSPGLIKSNYQGLNPWKNINFQNVIFENPATHPFPDYYCIRS